MPVGTLRALLYNSAPKQIRILMQKVKILNFRKLLKFN